MAVFVGTAPYLVTALTRSGHGRVYPWYLASTCLVSLIVYLASRETRTVDLRRPG